MGDVAIIGAGGLGGNVAHVLARSDSADTIRLLDDSGRVAAGKALDIMQAAPIEGFATQVSGASDMTAAVGAAFVVLADPARGGDWTVEEGLLFIKRLMRVTQTTVIVCAAPGGREIVERGVRELGVARTRLFGSAPEALAASLRALVAIEANRSPRDVALAVLGVPPSRVVVPWEDASIGGFGAVRVLDGPTRRRLEARVAPLWPPGPQALATAAAKAVEAALRRSRRTMSAFVAPDDAQGRRTRAAAMPVGLGPEGIERILLPSLTVHDRVALDNAIML
jgi:malate dehydrogenase